MKYFNINRTKEHDQLVSFCRPLFDHLGINYFWHYFISKNGEYSFIGTHTKWQEHCFENNLLASFPMLRHPALVESGITLMKNRQDPLYQQTLAIAKNTFKTSLNLNIVDKTSSGVEAFGFGSEISDPMQDQRLVNELPLLRYFIKTFKQKHTKLIEMMQTDQVNLAEEMGETFYHRPATTTIPSDRSSLLRKIGLGWILCLTPRERDILALLPSCVQCQEIAQTLSLSTRTVENYIATMKSKLNCSTKAQLIQKATTFIELALGTGNI